MTSLTPSLANFYGIFMSRGASGGNPQNSLTLGKPLCKHHILFLPLMFFALGKTEEKHHAY